MRGIHQLDECLLAVVVVIVIRRRRFDRLSDKGNQANSRGAGGH
jgi:hypothetical protein